MIKIEGAKVNGHIQAEIQISKDAIDVVLVDPKEKTYTLILRSNMKVALDEKQYKLLKLNKL